MSLVSTKTELYDFCIKKKKYYMSLVSTKTELYD